jgi:hypothetical protein
MTTARGLGLLFASVLMGSVDIVAAIVPVSGVRAC